MADFLASDLCGLGALALLAAYVLIFARFKPAPAGRLKESLSDAAPTNR